MSLVKYLNVLRILPNTLFALYIDAFTCGSKDPSSDIIIHKSLSTEVVSNCIFNLEENIHF